MSKRKNKAFPATDNGFNTAFVALMNHLAIPDVGSSAPTTPTWQRLGIPATTVYDVLVAMLGNDTTPNTWLSVYPLQANKPTRSGILKTQKNTLKKNGLAIIRPLRMNLKGQNELTPGLLTEADRQFFYIPIPDPKTPANLHLAEQMPLLSMHAIKHLSHTIDAHNPDTPESAGLPYGVVFVWLKRYMGTTAPTDLSQFSHYTFSGSFRTISTFLATQAKQDVWYTACYIGTTGAMSAFSPFLHTTVSQSA